MRWSDEGGGGGGVGSVTCYSVPGDYRDGGSLGRFGRQTGLLTSLMARLAGISSS